MSSRSWSSRKRKKTIGEDPEQDIQQTKKGKQEGESDDDEDKLRDQMKQKTKDTEVEDSDEEPSESPNQNEVPVCTHLKNIRFEAVKKKVLNPSAWSCKECSTTEQVWACLSCGYIGCGRYIQGHARDHWEKTKHAIVLEINSKLCHCYKCNNWVSNDDKGEHIQKFRDLLEQAQTESHQELHDKPNFQPKLEDFKKLDKLNTFLKRWKLFHLAKAFNKWKEVIYEEKQAKQDQMQIDSGKQEKSSKQQGPSSPRVSIQGTPIVPGQTGLRNLGNTCFMNSIVQALSHNEEFREYFVNTLLPQPEQPGNTSSVTIGPNTFVRQATIECLRSVRQKAPPKLEEISVAMQLHQLLRVLWSGKWAVVTPLALLDAVWKFVPKFKNRQQQDAQEFWCLLRDKLHEEITGSTVLKDQMKQTSAITVIFEGKLSSEVVCLKCKTSSKTVDAFADLSLDIPVVSLARGGRRSKKAVPTCSLEDCLKSYTAAENLDGKIRQCDNCKTKEDAIKRLKIETLPNVLCIVLKRFSWTATARAKINTKVTFPLRDLDLASFSNEKEDTVYELESVIMHHGTSLISGHYTAYCFHRPNDTWIHFNDSTVTVVTEEEVASAEAYILFYKRRLPEEEFSIPQLQVSNSPFKPVLPDSVFLRKH